MKINLKDLYPDRYKADKYIEVADEIPDFLEEYHRAIASYERKRYRYHAYYSLNGEDGIENDILDHAMMPAEILEQKYIQDQLYAAMISLSSSQARRIYARFYLEMTILEISRVENVSVYCVSASIQRGLKNGYVFEEIRNDINLRKNRWRT